MAYTRSGRSRCHTSPGGSDWRVRSTLSSTWAGGSNFRLERGPQRPRDPGLARVHLKGGSDRPGGADRTTKTPSDQNGTRIRLAERHPAAPAAVPERQGGVPAPLSEHPGRGVQTRGGFAPPAPSISAPRRRSKSFPPRRDGWWWGFLECCSAPGFPRGGAEVAAPRRIPVCPLPRMLGPGRWRRAEVQICCPILVKAWRPRGPFAKRGVLKKNRNQVFFTLSPRGPDREIDGTPSAVLSLPAWGRERGELLSPKTLQRSAGRITLHTAKLNLEELLRYLWHVSLGKRLLLKTAGRKTPLGMGEGDRVAVLLESVSAH
nr:uncharacterized protein LOC106028187 [Cavia porcellus]